MAAHEKIRPSAPIALLLSLTPLALTSACQRYAPAPLDLAAHRASVAGRNPAAAEVVEYARRLAAPAHARPADYDPADGLSLEEAEAVALVFNPRLRLARLRAEVPRVGAAEAGRWADPTLNVDAERILQSVDDRWVAGGTLGFTIPLSGRLGVEKAHARAEASAAQWRALAEERRVVARLRAAWLEWSVTAERARLTKAHADELAAVVATADRLLEVGEVTPVDARLVRLEQIRQTAQLRALEDDRAVAQTRLKTLLGLSPEAAVTLVPSLDAGPATDDAAALAGNAQLRVLEAEYAVAERALELEVRRQYPDLEIGGGFGTDEGDDRALLSASLPLPILNANRRAIAEARAAREVARAAAEARYEQLLGELAAARIALAGAEARVRYVEQELAPLADRQVQDAVRLGRAGEFESLLLVESLRAAHEAKLDVLDARAAAALARRSIEALADGGSPEDEEGQTHDEFAQDVQRLRVS